MLDGLSSSQKNCSASGSLVRHNPAGAQENGSHTQTTPLPPDPSDQNTSWRERFILMASRIVSRSKLGLSPLSGLAARAVPGSPAMCWCARNLLRQVKLIIDENVHTNPGSPSIA
jgi:hypothetical protein